VKWTAEKDAALRELVRDNQDESWDAIGIMFGSTGCAVRKRAVKLKIYKGRAAMSDRTSTKVNPHCDVVRVRKHREADRKFIALINEKLRPKEMAA